MANFITGREIIMGAKLASSWRTAVSIGANDGVLITGESMGAKAPTMLPDDSLGRADIKEMIQTHESISGASLNGYYRYEGWDVLLALALGTAGVPTQITGTAYQNSYTPADNIDGKFATLGIKKSATTHSIWEIPSAKVMGFTLSAEVGRLAQIVVNVMGNKIENDDPVNTSLASVTYPDESNIAKMDSRTKVRMNTQSGGALADSDAIYPFSFELTYNRPFDEHFEAGYSDMSEPVQNGFAESRLRLRFDKYNLDDFMDAIADEEAKKLDILLEGAAITGGTRYQLRIDIPKLIVLSAGADVGSAGTIPHVVEARPLAVNTAPTGMSGVLDPLRLYVQNTRSSDPLA